MKFEFSIAKRLQLISKDSKSKSATFTLNIATFGIALAIVIMVASIAIVSGFKTTIVHKLTDLQPHIKITNGQNISESPIKTIDYSEILQILKDNNFNNITSASPIFETPCIFKTNNEFAGLIFKGIDKDYDRENISKCIFQGYFKTGKDSIVISKGIATKLNLSVGDRPIVYFTADGKIKQRRLTIAGIFSSEFEEFDRNFIFGNINIARSVNRIEGNLATSAEIRLKDIDGLENTKQKIIDSIYNYLYTSGSNSVFQMVTITEEFSSYFAWLDLLDTNIVVILALMTLVACFSLIAGLLIVVLNRTNMIGILKSMGASNSSIQKIFIILAGKLIGKAMIIGNAIGFAIIILQKHFHVIKLDPETYYMSFVPVDINAWLIALNIGVAIISIIALIGPSFIVTSISLTKTIKFE